MSYGAFSIKTTKFSCYDGIKEQYLGRIQDRCIRIYSLRTYSSHNMNPELQTQAMYFLCYFSEPFSTFGGRPSNWIRDYSPPFIYYIKSKRIWVSTRDLSSVPKVVRNHILQCREIIYIQLHF